jgi:hypothetical protein
MSQSSPTESGEEEHSERRRSPKRSEMSIGIIGRQGGEGEGAPDVVVPPLNFGSMR